jgi:4-hydroxy-tetrahydrodipicolinate reductase
MTDLDSTTTTPLFLGLAGAGGRMGVRLAQLIAEDTTLKLVVAIERGDHPSLGEDAGTRAGLPSLGVPLVAELPPEVHLDAVVDFSTPAASLVMAEACARRGTPLVVGTTGFEPEERARIEAHARVIPILIASNFSKAVNLLFQLVSEAARALGPGADVEIIERHHHFKKDAPSGTALSLAKAVTDATAAGPLIHGRTGQVGARPKGEIGMHALRTGDNPGEHTVVFGLMGECLELSHRALNRDGFARGALDAARFLAGKPPGLYTMRDVLGLSSSKP